MVRRSLYSRPQEDALARAVLTFCLDGADALMYATVKGAGNAAEALRLLIESLPGTAGCDAAMRKLEGTFLVGLSRWGRKPDNRAIKVFRRSVEGWHARLGVLPSLDWHGLEGWFTMDGSQWLIGPQDDVWPAQLADLSTHKDWAAPLCLWGMGDERALTSCASPVAVVGSRGVPITGGVWPVRLPRGPRRMGQSDRFRRCVGYGCRGAIGGALALKFRSLAKVSGRGVSSAELGMAPWQVQKARREVRGWTDSQLAEAIRVIAQADEDAKGASRDPQYALEAAVRKICLLRQR